MCGLVGVAGNLYKKDIDVFNQLLFCNTLRGFDSTGVASVDAKREVTWFKLAVTAPDIMMHKAYDRVVTMTSRVIIGHNRAGTTGAKSKANAHPFILERIVGAHNGTLSYLSKKKMEDGSKFDTDSEALFNNIDVLGVDDTIPKLEGAWALTFYDGDAHTINFIRNSERPLYYCFNKQRTVMYWASELGLLTWILSRNGVEVDKFNMLPEDMLYTWKLTENNEEFGEAETRKLEGVKKPPQHTQPSVGMVGGLRGNHSAASGDSNGKEKGRWSELGRSNQSGSIEKLASPPSRTALINALDAVDWTDQLFEWWSDPVIGKLKIEFGDHTPWHWRLEETDRAWLRRIQTMLKLGWDLYDPKASAILKPHRKFENHLNVDKTAAWNPEWGQLQALPYFGAFGFWSEVNGCWVFDASDVNKELSKTIIDGLRNLKPPARPPLMVDMNPNRANIPAKSAVSQLLDEHEEYQKVKAKADSGKRLTKMEREILANHDDTEVVKDNVVPFKVREYKFPDGTAMSSHQFKFVTQHGCDWCNRPIKFGEDIKFAEIDNVTECFCDYCAKLPDVREYIEA